VHVLYSGAASGRDRTGPLVPPAGELNSEQHRTWAGRWPADGAALAALPDVLERSYVRSLRRYSFGLVRYRRSAGRVDCSLPGGMLFLVLDDLPVQAGPARVERRWRIVSGLLGRPNPATDAAQAVLALGVERLAGGRNHAWIGVTAFRSRFLAPLPRFLLAIRPVWALVGWLYTGYHARAGGSCLRDLAASPELGVVR
jgi:hypothetical protein